MWNFMQVMAVLLMVLVCGIFVHKLSLMSILICLEMLMFLMLLMSSLFVVPNLGALTFLPIFLCFAASGAAVGLTLLVSMSRLYGNDMIKSLPFEKIAWISSFIKSS